MSKPKTQPVGLSFVQHEKEHVEERGNEPLSGSKKIKNGQHSRNNHGEGS
jgi:small acid-soluble spore protein P (minor)